MTEDEREHTAFIEEQRAWLQTYRTQTGLSGNDMAKRLNVKEGTLTNFWSARGYSGRELPLAEAVVRYRNELAARDITYLDAPEVPGFYETQTSAEIHALLHWAMRGKLVGGALGSGTGKTTACERFAEMYPNIFITTLLNSQGGQGPLQVQVLNSLGVGNQKGTPATLSSMIIDKLRTMHRPVLIIDEAQHCNTNSLEEIRGWRDATGAGIALFGDKRLHDLIFNGKGKDDIPQFRRRIKMIPTRIQPYSQDVAAMAAAWNIHDRRMIVELERFAQHPGAIGRATDVLEMAALIAAAEKKPMALAHLQEAIAEVDRKRAAA